MQPSCRSDSIDGDAATSRPGGRQGALPLAIPGGGSRNICTISDAAFAAPASDAEGIADLRRIGLSAAWVSVAEAIGYAGFMSVWRALAEHPALDDRGRLVVPLFTDLIRYRRNQLVRQLIGAGASNADIVKQVKRTFGEVLKYRTIKRLRLENRLQL